MHNTTCDTTQKVRCVLTPRTAPTTENPEGLPTEIDGPIRVALQSGDGSFELDPENPLAFWAISGPGTGDTQYLVEGDAVPGEGERLISETVVLTVTAAEAQGFSVVSSEPPVQK